MSKHQLVISKASVHNLKSVSCVIPHGTLCCLTGVSGSGKSSFAFDTVFVEGQRRYVQSLSHQAKRIIGSLPKPEVESISGLTPTIAIEQKTTGGSPRSTVATLTEIHDYLRVLYARLAVPYCPESGTPLVAISRNKILERIFSRYSERQLMILAPYVKRKKGALKEDLQDLEHKGYSRVRLDRAITRISDIHDIDPNAFHDIDIVVDRLNINEAHRQRIKESTFTALEAGKGVIILFDSEDGGEELLSEHAYSQATEKSYPPLEPNDFSFNNPSGMCSQCQGLGECHEFLLDSIIDPQKSIAQDCCCIAGSYQTIHYRNIYENLASLFHFSVRTAWKDLTKEAQHILLYGAGNRWVRMVFINPNTGSTWTDNVQWKGILHEAKKKYHTAKSAQYKRQMEEYMRLSTCKACRGSRLQPYPSAARLQECTIHELCSKPIDEVYDFFCSLKLPSHQAFAEESIRQVRSRLAFLKTVGLGYLSLERQTTTLSGGEFQRVRLASQMGSSLVGITYVLDEPSIGLHPHDNEKLVESLQELRNRGNTVLVVEHDEEMMRASDWIVDFGIGAGDQGGQILHQGPLQDLEAVSESVTSDYLFGRKSIHAPEKKKSKSKKILCLRGVCHRNISNLDLEIPLERFIAVTGVSGSGKSSLIFETLYPALSNLLMHSELASGGFESISGLEHLDKVIHIDQTPIGRTPRSNPATYSGVFDDIRALYASLPESKARGFSAGQFSFNVKRSVCSTCSGMGVIPVDMDFLEQAWVTCASCDGKRYNSDTLSIQYKGKSILDILNMSCREASEFFASIPAIKAGLDTLCRVGLDYIQLGQSATTLSGGEAQRLKIAKELSRPATGKTLYLLDEPTTGLHVHDVSRLLDVLHELVSRGNTVLVIEHNMELVKTADTVIDIGPGAGSAGGKIIATGHPRQIAQLQTPTGIALKKALFPPPLVPQKPPSKDKGNTQQIHIVGARQNTLQNISLSLPKESLIAVIGPSGSGKSSLAFDTLFAEGQRQYVESLSPYARYYIEQMPRPIVDSISGLPPTVAITQRHHASNPRSTVGTITEIYDYLRIFWACLGIPHCPKTGSVIRPMSKDRVADIILSWEEKTPVYILAPCRTATSISAPHLIDHFSSLGFCRFRLNGTFLDVSREDLPSLKQGRKITLEVVVDRLRPSQDEKQRLISSIDEASRIGEKSLIIHRNDGDRAFNLSFAVETTGETYPQITAQTFAFNTPSGMCPECHGLGIEVSKSSLVFLVPSLEFPFPLKGNPCPTCKGSRLNPLARNVTINDLSIVDFCHMPMTKARQWFSASVSVSSLQKPLQRVFEEIDHRLSLIEDLGLGYLSLDRCATTLSGGEAQRVQLISQIGSHLSGLLYVIDEPSTGLHPHDSCRLLSVLSHLKAQKNSIILVEHDPQLISQADHIIELGPHGGKEGGHIIGTYNSFSSSSPTLDAFQHSFDLNDGSSISKDTQPIIIHSASCHNLNRFSCELPSQALIGIVGVSGSGKSTLLFDVIEAAMVAHLEKTSTNHISIRGLETFERLITIDQQPISQNSRSDLSTFLDLFTHLRQFFASLPAAKALGLDPSCFSTFHRKGMCKHCMGLGEKRIDMHFLPSVRMLCEECHGLRLNPASLSVEFKGKNLGQILQCSVEEVKSLFSDHKKICRYLDSLIDVGLSYLALGQEMASLSSGEAQRIKLAKELVKSRRVKTLYLMDEPTTGLHIREVKGVISQLKRLTEEGHTVIVVEHNIDVIGACDFLLELGPGAGPDGGKVVAQGSPLMVARNKKSPTGRYLRERIRE